MEICVECKEKPVVIKKWELCMSCYNRAKRIERAIKTDPEAGRKTPMVALRKGFEREMEFVRNFFDHNDWVYQPAKFRIGTNDSYTPDFYDVPRNVFIEVVGTRQAFHYNAEKYEQFNSQYPSINLEIRYVSGELHYNQCEFVEKG